LERHRSAKRTGEGEKTPMIKKGVIAKRTVRGGREKKREESARGGAGA